MKDNQGGEDFASAIGKVTITEYAFSGSPSSVQVSCDTQDAVDEVEVTSAAGSSTLTLDDGNLHQALFRFRQ